ncbi:MAG: thioredoxin domain-containing protein [candidate division WOR-3 bacterium]
MANKLKYLIIGAIAVLLILVVILVASYKRPGVIVNAPEIQTRDTITQEKNDIYMNTLVQAKTVSNSDDPLALTDDILAIVDNIKITSQQLDSMLNAMPSQIKEYYKDDKPGFLEELITRQLLINEAKRQKVNQQDDYKDLVKQNPDKKEDIMVNLLLRKIVSNVTVNENELRDFFNQYKDQLPNKDYESVKEQLRPMAIEEKQRLKIEEFINNLKAKAKIVRNDKWIKEQAALTADNPLSRALKSGRPVLADFGRGTCIPCKMMQPILEKLQKEYAGKAEILIIDVGEYASLARQYKIMMIPTQIFFDKSGKEVYRHQGFMPEQDIISQLKKLGVE